MRCLLALRTTNGRVLWSDTLTAARQLEGLSNFSDIRGMPVIDRGLVLAISFGGRMNAIDMQSGSRIWSKRIGGVQMPWVAGDFIFVVSNDNELVALLRDNGAIRWVRPLQKWTDEDQEERVAWSGPILANGQLILVNQIGQMVFISAKDGTINQTFNIGASLRTLPIIAQNTLFILDENGSLRAWR
ncbi:MAG: PQQ-binding-like beta-propeller repeat protein [Pseudomonadota bacterium]